MNLEMPSFKSPEVLVRERLGIAFSTKRKDGGQASLAEQLNTAEQLDLPSAQFDFRHQSDDDIAAGAEMLKSYRERHPEGVLSIHGETAHIDPAELQVDNSERLLAELTLAIESGATSYTMHPPSVSVEAFAALPDDIKKRALDAYCALYVEAISTAIENGQSISLALENMNTSGPTGAWGQKVEEVASLITSLETALVARTGIEQSEASAYIGATLDINHALHDAKPEEYERILTEWISLLGERLKVIHLYTPSDTSPDLRNKYDIAVRLAAEYSPDARIFLESKQDEDTTMRIFEALASKH